jgi:ACS family sodium-dependent inorganic phosphate cotransporter-like MFS transporter 5
LIGGYLCVHGFDGGWPSIFYSFGIAGIIWCVLWYFLFCDNPNEHKFITDTEKQYLASEITEEFDKKITVC